MFGAQKFQFYVESSITRQLEKCLNKYQQLGILDVRPWSLPEELGRLSVSFITRDSIYDIARIYHRNSVCPNRRRKRGILGTRAPLKFGKNIFSGNNYAKFGNFSGKKIM